MGLFSNNKKLCPVCGNPTPRLLATKIQDTPICKECDKKIYLPKGRTDRMTIDDFKQYIQFYEDNQALRDQFEENYSFNFGLFGGDLVLDIFHGLFRVNCDKDSLAFQADNLKSFRILEDSRYIGEKGYPALIEPEQLRTAAEKRTARACPPQKTPAQKTLRRLCGAPPSERVEKIVTDLLNELIRCPDRIQPAASQMAAACGKTREDLTTALERQPIDEDNARALLLQLAAEQYDTIGNTEYETVRLRRLLTGRKPMTELDAELLQSAVSKVCVTNKCVTVMLKNRQVIERRDPL